MKILSTVLAVVLFAASAALATTPFPGVFGTGQWKDKLYSVSPTRQAATAAKWHPEKEDPPLSVSRALAAARLALKKLVGEEAVYFECEEVKLAQHAGHWFFFVRFFSRDERVATKGEVGVFPAILPFIVYLDGVVELPFEKRG